MLSPLHAKQMVIVRDKEPRFRIVKTKRAPRIVQPRKPTAPVIAPKKKAKPAPRHKLMRFDAKVDISGADSKKFDVIKSGDQVVDYQNVVVKGYLSTFKGTTASDRDGEYVEPGAFKDCLPRFRKNPVMLRDHRNAVEYQCGSFTVIKEDSKGLYVEGLLSNSPADFMKHTRALVAEGHLKTMSMGGLFYYKDDGRGIFKVELYEGTLTPIPANPDALFSVRALTDHERKWLKFVEPPG